jgi:hypothetical membrane protein
MSQDNIDSLNKAASKNSTEIVYDGSGRPRARLYNPIRQLNRQQHIRLGLFAMVGFLIFFIGQVIAQLGFAAPYSISRQTISELGITTCGDYTNPVTGEIGYVCSPLHWVMNGTFVLYGILVMLATNLAIGPLWPGRRLRKIGLLLIFFSGIGAVVSGLAPQDLMPIPHMTAGALAIASINIGLILLGFAALIKQPVTGSFALLCGIVGMVGWIMLGTPPYAGLGYGGWQRVAGFPFVIWGICMGAYWLITSKDFQ